MNIKKYLFRLISIPFIFLSVLGLVETLFDLINPSVSLPWESLVTTMGTIGILILFGYLFLFISFNRQETKEKFSNICIKVMFFFYCITVVVVLFGSGTFVRHGSGGFGENNIWQSMNLVPMRTISSYFKALIYDDSRYIALSNLIGNFLIFAPMGFFLPYFQKEAKRIIIFIGEISLILILVELLQLFSTRGICDIDDIILNLFGAILFWLLCRTKCIKKLLNYLCIRV